MRQTANLMHDCFVRLWFYLRFIISSVKPKSKKSISKQFQKGIQNLKVKKFLTAIHIANFRPFSRDSLINPMLITVFSTSSTNSNFTNQIYKSQFVNRCLSTKAKTGRRHFSILNTGPIDEIYLDH